MSRCRSPRHWPGDEGAGIAVPYWEAGKCGLISTSARTPLRIIKPQDTRGLSQCHQDHVIMSRIVGGQLIARDNTLLEKRLLAPVEEGLWYRFFQPVPGKWYQWLGSSEPVPKALLPKYFCQKGLAGIRTQDLWFHIHLSYHLTYTSLLMGRDIFLLK